MSKKPNRQIIGDRNNSSNEQQHYISDE